jgi:hypothetical protein
MVGVVADVSKANLISKSGRKDCRQMYGRDIYSSRASTECDRHSIIRWRFDVIGCDLVV